MSCVILLKSRWGTFLSIDRSVSFQGPSTVTMYKAYHLQESLYLHVFHVPGAHGVHLSGLSSRFVMGSRSDAEFTYCRSHMLDIPTCIQRGDNSHLTVCAVAVCARVLGTVLAQNIDQCLHLSTADHRLDAHDRPFPV